MKPPKFEIYTQKDDDGTYSAVIRLSEIPNKRLAKMSLDWMREAMDDQIIKLLGRVTLQERRDARDGDA